MKLVWMAALCLALGACGGGGNGSGDAAAPAAGGGSTPAAHAVVSGVAATGNGVAGRVYIKDAAGQEQFVDTITGSFSFNADGMTPPFLLRIQVGSGGSAQTLYSFATAAGTANITPLTSLAVLGAAGNQSLEALYANPSPAGFGVMAAALPAAVGALKQSLAPLLAQFSVSDMDPIAGTFAADHTGMDALLDAITVSFGGGGDVVVADKASGATLLDAPTADLSRGMTVPAWTAPDAANASDPDLAVDATGKGLVVWSDSSSANYPIRARFLTAAGSTPVTLNPSGQAMTPKVAFDGQGNAIVVWAQYENNRNDVWARRYVAATGNWAPALRVSSNGAVDSVGPPDLAVDGAGNALVTWHQGDGRANHFDQWFARYDTATGWSAPVLASDGINSAYGGRVALNAAGRGLLVWQQEQGDGTLVSNGPNDVWARRVDATGTPQPATMINSVAGNTLQVYGQVAVALDAAGNGAVLWVQGRIHAAMMSAAGNWQASQPVLGDASHGAYGPDLAFDAAGNAVAVWQEQDGSNAFLGSNRYQAGTGWGTSTTFVAGAPGDVYLPKVAIDGAGNATAVWYQAAVNGAAQVFGSRLRAGSGTGWGTARIISGTATDGFFTYPVPVVASNTAGQALVVWGVNSN